MPSPEFLVTIYLSGASILQNTTQKGGGGMKRLSPVFTFLGWTAMLFLCLYTSAFFIN